MYGLKSFNPNQTDVWEALPGLGGGLRKPPPCYLGSGANFCSKIMFPQKLASISTHLAHFQNIFSKNHKKIGENWKSIKKLLKMSENSKICNFWTISTCNTSKESIFHIEINFKKKGYDFSKEELKKIKFFFFWC